MYMWYNYTHISATTRNSNDVHGNKHGVRGMETVKLVLDSKSFASTRRVDKIIILCIEKI